MSYVGPTLSQPLGQRWANLHLRRWANVGLPTLGQRYLPTLGQRMNVIWGLTHYDYELRLPRLIILAIINKDVVRYVISPFIPGSFATLSVPLYLIFVQIPQMFLKKKHTRLIGLEISSCTLVFVDQIKKVTIAYTLHVP